MKPKPDTTYLEHPERADYVGEDDAEPTARVVVEDITQVTKLHRGLDEVLREAARAAEQAEASAEQAERVFKRPDSYSNLKKNLSTRPPAKK